ncbi:hypothetical protein BC832DRAFT_107528 [Gaertneriomyces semiglobifer]|nr:hypothetical protein BC832DRAFT_107528 [Gaertneriomyces semiglobifer]
MVRGWQTVLTCIRFEDTGTIPSYPSSNCLLLALLLCLCCHCSLFASCSVLDTEMPARSARRTLFGVLARGKAYTQKKSRKCVWVGGRYTRL